VRRIENGRRDAGGTDRDLGCNLQFERGPQSDYQRDLKVT
jgi:hypothetical protein